MKPERLFAREYEWAELSAFVASGRTGARLAVMAGRRRQGKTMLLQALADQFGGFYWQARQQSSMQNLVSFGAALGRYIGAPTGLRFDGWEAAVDALVDTLTSRESGALAVIDEVGYLISTEPAFASHLQAALAPGNTARQRGQARIVLCGSAFGQMRKLIDADSPLRGRSDVELTLRPFAWREAAVFWGLGANPDAAFRLHALVGGTPAYRDYGVDLPTEGDIDRWAIANLLNVGSPLFHEGRVVIAEDPALADQSLYWGVLGAIAEGAEHRADVAEALGRPATSLAHALATVVDAGWVVAEADPLRDRHTAFRIDEPMVRFHRLVIEPHDARLTLRRDRQGVWTDVLPLIRSHIYGPHLERLTKDWILAHASARTMGGVVTSVGSSVLTTGRRSGRVQLDVVAVGSTSRGGTEVLAIGEVKAGIEPAGVTQLSRLEAVEHQLTESQINRVGTTQPLKKLLVARAGFTVELQRLARHRIDVELVDLQRLYSGD